VIHLAARVGGIGANGACPAEFFYNNLMMGAQVFHEAWKAGIGKFVTIGTVRAYPKHTPVPFKEENLVEQLPRGDQRVLRADQEDAAGAVPGLPIAVRL